MRGRAGLALAVVALALLGLCGADEYSEAWLDRAGQLFGDSPPAAPAPGPPAVVGYFLRDMPRLANGSGTVQGLPDWLAGHRVYRSVPSKWPEGMDYHYDGLASPMRFDFGPGGKLSWRQAAYQSGAWKHYEQCLWLGSGSLHLGPRPCLTNPGVNILPVSGQLWMTIDNRFWGMIDAETLQTPARLGVRGLLEAYTVTMNAHPACDYNGNSQCLVSYPCGASSLVGLTETFDADQLCVGVLRPGGGRRAIDMAVAELSRTVLPGRKFLAHSHQPGITKHWFVNKVDSFVLSHKDRRDAGMLRHMHQAEDDLWLVMDRRTNETRILKSDLKFVNNHFGNIYETEDYIVVDTMPGTANYLDNYFRHNLANQTWLRSRWDWIMMTPARCLVPTRGNATIKCEPLLRRPDPRIAAVGMDFPSFNPYYKYNASSRWLYVTSPRADNSMWFDAVVKLDTKTRAVAAVYHQPGVYVMEANFIPRPGGTDEDDGVLFSVFYNATADSSFVAFVCPRTMKLQAKLELGTVIPYHSHGVLCLPSGKCFANP